MTARTRRSLGSVAELAAIGGAAGCSGAGIEVEHHLLAAQARELERLAAVANELYVGCEVAFFHAMVPWFPNFNAAQTRGIAEHTEIVVFVRIGL